MYTCNEGRKGRWRTWGVGITALGTRPTGVAHTGPKTCCETTNANWRLYCLQKRFRRRPYHAENTGSHLNSEVKQRRARPVLGWGTAREALRVLSAFRNRCASRCRYGRPALAMRASGHPRAHRASPVGTVRRWSCGCPRQARAVGHRYPVRTRRGCVRQRGPPPPPCD